MIMSAHESQLWTAWLGYSATGEGSTLTAAVLNHVQN